MKKYFILLVTFSAFLSCQNEEFEIINKSDTNIINDSNLNTRAPNINDFNYQLKLVTYITGRVLLKHKIVRQEVLRELVDNNSITFNRLLNIEIFKDAFVLEGSGFDLFGRPGSHRPIPPIGRSAENLNDNNLVLTRELWPLNNIYSIMQFIDNNCIEMKLIKPLILENYFEDHLFIAQHPLKEGVIIEGFNGFDLWEEEMVLPREEPTVVNMGRYILFDESLFNSFENNIIVVRPYRDEQCNYEFIPVNDFDKFFSL